MGEKNKHIYSKSLSYFAWQRLKKNKLAMVGLVIVGISIFVAVLGYLITPDSTPDTDLEILSLRIKPPGHKAKVLLIKKDDPAPEPGVFKKMIYGEPSPYEKPYALDTFWFEKFDVVFLEYRSDRHAGQSNAAPDTMRRAVADVVYAFNSSMPGLKNDSSTGFVEFYEAGKKEKSRKHIKDLQKEMVQNNVVEKTFVLGTDKLGRDMLSRMMIGTRISLSVGLISVFISIVIGLFMGAIGGYFRGWVDDVIMWLINVVWSIPTLLLVIAITLLLGKGIWQVFVAVGLTMWVDVARVVRGQILSVREKEFVEAGRALGFNHFRLIFRHVLPNVMGPVIVISAANFASAILVEAGLSFLGIGAQPPTPSWGAMINDHKGNIYTAETAYLPIVPGVAIMVMVLAFMLVGNGLRDALDTKSMDDDKVMGY